MTPRVRRGGRWEAGSRPGAVRPPALLRRGAAAAGLAALLALLPACGGDDAGGPGGEARREAPGTAGGGPRSGTAARQEADSAGAGRETAAEGAGRQLAVLDVAGHEVRVEVADDEAERQQGLMRRDSLPADQGMLFVYPEEQTLSFWMRDTDIPLDIAFLDRRGYIVDIQHMDPHTEELHRSSRPAMYALEMNRGWFRTHEVEVGDRVRF